MIDIPPQIDTRESINLESWTSGCDNARAHEEKTQITVVIYEK